MKFEVGGMAHQLIAFVVLVILDIFITVQVIQNGIGVESNWEINVLIQEMSLAKTMALKFVLTLFIIYVLYTTWTRREPVSIFKGKLNTNGESLAYKGAMLINIIYILVVLNNLMVYTNTIEPIYLLLRYILERV